VEKATFLVVSNLSMALVRPIIPSWIRSSLLMFLRSSDEDDDDEDDEEVDRDCCLCLYNILLTVEWTNPIFMSSNSSRAFCPLSCM